jgi:hypothetical protein
MIIHIKYDMMLIPLRKGVFIEKEPDYSISKNIERPGMRVKEILVNKMLGFLFFK